VLSPFKPRFGIDDDMARDVREAAAAVAQSDSIIKSARVTRIAGSDEFLLVTLSVTFLEKRKG
jgi:hypothetical protein